MTENTVNSAMPENSKDGTEVSKNFYRQKVWDYLEEQKLVTFPRPAFGRIPNFKGSEEAAARLADLEEFKAANSVEVNPDKPLEHSRILVIQNKKELYVPIPGLHNTLLKKLSAPDDSGKTSIKRLISRWGIEHTGKPVDVNENIRIDLLVVGSVAVSKEGHRIGKGKGYADLEFAILKEMGAIDDNTVIVTTVHDCQVHDTLPKEIFGQHDVPVDYILTPTQTIKVEPRLSRPKGIFWNILSQRRINVMSPLQMLKQKYEAEGNELTLKEDSDYESAPAAKKIIAYRRFKRRRPRSASKTSESEAVAGEGQVKPKQVTHRRRFYRRNSQKKPDDKNAANANGDSTENGEKAPQPRPYRIRRYKFPRFDIDFSLMVSNIEKDVRIRDLKNALSERGIKPNDITWKGYKGFCYLHYAKPNSKKAEVQEPFAVDSVIEILQTLKIRPESNNILNVKVMEPITRIETTDVTAV